jgi:CBS domain-containing protein
VSTVRDLLARKGPAVSVRPSTTVLEAAQIMGENGFGAVLVMDGDALIGIFTERDTLRRVVAAGRDPATTTVETVMTTSLFTCVPETSMEECGAIMSRHHIRHLPVVDQSGLLGLVSIGDLLADRVREQEETIRYLNSYMFNVR